MNADLLAMLGGAGLPGPSSSRREEEGKTILSFKAGKMDPVLQPNGKYLITADPRRGEVNLVFDLPSTLKFEWKDRRTRAVVDSFLVIPEDNCTFTGVPTGREGDRVNLLQFGSNPDRRFFFWMQDNVADGTDEANMKQVQTFLTNVNECIIAAGGEPPEEAPATAVTASATGVEVSSNIDSVTGTGDSVTGATSNTNASSSSNNNQQQVDALSNILGNLGMPQPSSAVNSASTPAPTTTPNTTTTGGTLTLADLQGAMAGLATHSPVGVQQQMPTPPLNELATTDAVDESGILDNPDAVARLMEFLPESQRTDEMLRENLRSPQVQQALQTLTQALVGDSDDGSSDYHSIVANFQLDAADGAAAMNSGNPIQAFLDCLVKKVEREKEEKVKNEGGGNTVTGGENNDNEPMNE